MEFEGVWLEVRTCASIDQAASIDSKGMEVASLLEVLEAAADANVKQRTSMWEYSRRLTPNEVKRVKEVINFIDTIEDEKSVSLLADVAYKSFCYTLTLFAIKGN